MIRAVRSGGDQAPHSSDVVVLALILFGYVAFTAGILGAAFGFAGDAGPTGPVLPHETLPPIVYSIATAVGYVMPLILGTPVEHGRGAVSDADPDVPRPAAPRRGPRREAPWSTPSPARCSV